jgi:superfamily II DNA helicase RecQ
MNSELLILTAPPASGKTYLISSLITQFEQPLLFISPLRALANECLAKWGESCVVMTPEEWLNKGKSARVVILDEFHLYFYWGNSFRPKMWEAFYELVQETELVIFMTATLTEEMKEEIKNFSCHFDQMTWVDHGNQRLKNRPHRYYKASSASWIETYLLNHSLASSPGVNLVFCAYRSEVLKWEKLLKEQGFSVWTCVGGEASAFSLKVQRESPPQFIVATTVLSHGVNLPNISRIFFLYEVGNLDFWIQMVARGGRKGESFEVFALENPVGIKWSKLFNSLAIARLSLKMKLHHLMKRIEEWFLKA